MQVSLRVLPQRFESGGVYGRRQAIEPVVDLIVVVIYAMGADPEALL